MSVREAEAPVGYIPAYIRYVVVAPTLMTFGSVAGEPVVLVAPPSPLPSTTVTPEATAALSASSSASRVVSGNSCPEIGWFMTLAPLVTA